MSRTFLVVLFFSLLSGCSSYQIPIETECHPACPNVATKEIQLSPILEINPATLPSRGGHH